MLSEMLRLGDILYETVESNAVTFSLRLIFPSLFAKKFHRETGEKIYIYISTVSRDIYIYIFF